MPKRYVLLLAIIFSLVIGMLGIVRTQGHTVFVATSSGKHLHQVYRNNSIQTQLIASANGLSALTIEARGKTDAKTDLQSTLINKTDAEHIPLSFTQADNDIRVIFEPQGNSAGKVFLLEIRADSASKEHALLLPYEIDGTKYPHMQVWQNDIAQQGSLAITEHERPTYA